MKEMEGFHGLAGAEVELFQKVLTGFSGYGVEIGCCDGYSSRVILEASNLHRLVSIDPMVPDSMEKSLCGSVERLEKNMADLSGRFRFIKETSQEAAEHIHGVLDFLFIDGDHSYEAALFDFCAWYPRLRIGGLLAMHDARMGRPDGAPFHEGPSRVAREHVFGCPKWEIVGEAFSLVIARRLP